MHAFRLAAFFALFSLSCAPAQAGVAEEEYGGRKLIVYSPSRLPPSGERALVVVLHGGMGSAERIHDEKAEKGMKLDAVAEQHNFFVAYLNGTHATRMLGGGFKSWNAGNCCGRAMDNNIDDVAYIEGAVNALVRAHAINPQRVYVIGHSNGAMMLLRVICERGVFRAGISVSGSAGTGAQASCPAARGRDILAIHGQEDANMPFAGGRGTKGLSKTDFLSQEATRRIFLRAGARYRLQALPNTDHSFDTIDAALIRAEGADFAHKAVRFFGLGK